MPWKPMCALQTKSSKNHHRISSEFQPLKTTPRFGQRLWAPQSSLCWNEAGTGRKRLQQPRQNCWNFEAVGDFEELESISGHVAQANILVRYKLTIFGTWYNVFRSSRMEMTQGTIEITWGRKKVGMWYEPKMGPHYTSRIPKFSDPQKIFWGSDREIIEIFFKSGKVLGLKKGFTLED